MTIESQKDSARQIALETISNLPEGTDMENIMYHLYVIDCIQKGQDALKNGDFVSAEELLKGSTKW